MIGIDGLGESAMNEARVAAAPRWRGAILKAVLFDLDGTLLDTADDIAAALNEALAEQRLRPLPAMEVRDMIGRGVPTLIARAIARLGRTARPVDQTSLLAQFCAHYGQIHRLRKGKSRVYPGVAAALDELHLLGLRLAVVTNKQRQFAQDLLEQLGLSHRIQLVVGGDSCPRRKPDPLPLHYACETLLVNPEQALMVGDSATDVLAARAAGLPIVCVPYGYNEGRDPRDLDCDALIETLAELPALLLAGAA